MKIEEKIDRLRKLEAKATVGPWSAEEGFCSDHQTTEVTIYGRPKGANNLILEVVESPCECMGGEATIKRVDAEFIAFVRNNALDIIDSLL